MRADNVPVWTRARIPPCVCRILARKKAPGGKELLMTDGELMVKTGWGKKHLRAVYQSANWNRVTNLDTDLFLWACGLRPSTQRREVWKLQRAWRGGMDGIRNMRHLRTDAPWQVSQVQTLLRMIERVLEDEE